MEMKSEPTPAWSAHHPVLCGYVKMILGDLCIVHVVVRSSRADASVWTTIIQWLVCEKDGKELVQSDVGL